MNPHASGADDVHLYVRVWLERNQGNLMGPGRIELLEMIDRLGSLRQAAEALGISYRAAWGKLKSAESRMGRPLVCKAVGRGNRFEITPFARELMRCYAQLQHDVADYARRRGRELFSRSELTNCLGDIVNEQENACKLSP